jgi:hypothetical protein
LHKQKFVTLAVALSRLVTSATSMDLAIGAVPAVANLSQYPKYDYVISEQAGRRQLTTE